MEMEKTEMPRRQEAEVVEMKMLRFALGVTRMERISNGDNTGTTPVRCSGGGARQARLRWSGDVQRRDREYDDGRTQRVEQQG